MLEPERRDMDKITIKLLYLKSHAEDNNTRPIDKRMAKAKFDGAVEAAHAMGLGATPFAVEMAVLDWYRANPIPPWSPSNNQPRRDWEAKAVTELGAKLKEIDNNAHSS
jgi:hypothetical protein